MQSETRPRERTLSTRISALFRGALVAGAALLLAASSAPDVRRTEAPIPVVPGNAWDLWAGGTSLRGANIWQRFVVPDLDGEEFLGQGPIGPPYTQADFDRLASLGANYVNLSHPGLFTETPPYTLDPDAQANLDHLLEMAAQADLFVVITFRTGPGRSDFTFYRDGAGEWYDPDLLIESVWSDPEAQQAWAAMWRYTAERYGDNPVVVGFDLLCEPNPDEAALGVEDPQDFYPAYAGTLYDWNTFYPRLAAAIREVDPETPILVSPMGWGSVGWLPYLQPIRDPHIVYTIHQYSPHPYTHQDPPDAVAYPGELDLDGDGRLEAFDRRWLRASLGPLDDFLSEARAPVAVNEFGVARWAPGAAQFLSDEMSLFEARGLNYAVWVWDSTWRPCTHQVNAFGLRFGPDPENETDVPNDVLTALERAWGRNSIRPSGLMPVSRP
jgi:hypothetical protein